MDYDIHEELMPKTNERLNETTKQNHFMKLINHDLTATSDIRNSQSESMPPAKDFDMFP